MNSYTDAGRGISFTWSCQVSVNGFAATLTRAEDDLLRLLATGMPPMEAAYVMGKSYQTIKNQLTAIYARLEVNSLAQAFVRRGWLIAS